MSKPEWCPQWAWDEALIAFGGKGYALPPGKSWAREGVLRIARALLAAYEKGRVEQREVTEVAVAEVDRLWNAMPYMQQIQLKFPVGARVKMTESGIRQFPRYEGKLGTIKRFANGGWSPSVKWDHRKTEASYAHEFLEVVEPA